MNSNNSMQNSENDLEDEEMSWLQHSKGLQINKIESTANSDKHMDSMVIANHMSEVPNEFIEKLKKYIDQELIDCYNSNVKNSGWVAARGRFIWALQRELLRRKFDISAISSNGDFPMNTKVELIDNKIIPINNQL